MGAPANAAQIDGGPVTLQGGSDAITNLLNTLNNNFTDKTTTDSTTTGGSTKTTQTQMSPEAIQGILNQILGGSQGLASLTAGERNSGLYNSTTNQQLTNDLLARTTAAVAEKGAPTVTTSSPQTTTDTKTVQAPTIAKNPILALAAGYVGNRLLKSSGLMTHVDNTIDAAGKTIRDTLFGGSGSAGILSDTGSSVLDTSGIGSVIDGQTADQALQAAVPSFTTEAAVTSSLTDTAGEQIAGTAADANILGSAGADALGSNILSDIIPGAQDITLANGVNNLLGQPIGGDLGNILQGAAGSINSVTKDAVSFAGGAINDVTTGVDNIAHGVSDAVSGVGDAVGGVFDAVTGGGCFITTVVCGYMRLPDDCFELQRLREFRDSYMAATVERAALVRQYYETAPAISVAVAHDPMLMDELYVKILRAVDAIVEQRYEDALQIYTSIYQRARSAVRDEELAHG